MQPYDKAYELARSIRKGEEYQRLSEKKKEVEQNEKYREILNTYRSLQAELQTYYLRDEKPSDEVRERADKMTTLIQGIATLSEYLQAEERFTILMQDIQRIVLDPMQEILLKEES